MTNQPQSLMQQGFHKSQAAPQHSQSFHISDNGIELLKWLALVAMVVDHINAVFYGRELGVVADAIGRVAMPVFSFVLAYNLARPGADLRRSLRRLLGFGVLAQLPFMAAFGYGWLPLNILFTFAVAVGVLVCLDDGRAWSALALGVLAGLLVEYAWAGVGLVIACVLVCRWGRFAWPWGGLAAAFAGLCGWNGNGWALLAVPLVVAAACWSPAVPRLRRWFWWFYPAHLAALTLTLG